MNESPVSVRIIVAEDDADDRLLLSDAFEDCGLTKARADITFVENGEDLLDCLLGRRAYALDPKRKTPPIVLLDLNMPRMDGREALKAIKSNLTLRCVPVIILTTSHQDADVRECYEHGANSYISKPPRYVDLVRMASHVKDYWLDIVKHPRNFGSY